MPSAALVAGITAAAAVLLALHLRQTPAPPTSPASADSMAAVRAPAVYITHGGEPIYQPLQEPSDYGLLAAGPHWEGRPHTDVL